MKIDEMFTELDLLSTVGVHAWVDRHHKMTVKIVSTNYHQMVHIRRHKSRSSSVKIDKMFTELDLLSTVGVHACVMC